MFDFSCRWPRTMAGITSHQYCLQLRYPSLSVEGGSEQKKASRYCDRSGKWQEGDYSNCLYTSGITRVLHTFILVSGTIEQSLNAVLEFFKTYVLNIFTLDLLEAHQCIQCCHCGTSSVHIHSRSWKFYRLSIDALCGRDYGQTHGACYTAARSEKQELSHYEPLILWSMIFTLLISALFPSSCQRWWWRWEVT